jgi:hypothetical protein
MALLPLLALADSASASPVAGEGAASPERGEGAHSRAAGWSRSPVKPVDGCANPSTAIMGSLVFTAMTSPVRFDLKVFFHSSFLIYTIAASKSRYWDGFDYICSLFISFVAEYRVVSPSFADIPNLHR